MATLRSWLTWTRPSMRLSTPGMVRTRTPSRRQSSTMRRISRPPAEGIATITSLTSSRSTSSGTCAMYPSTGTPWMCSPCFEGLSSTMPTTS